MGTSHAAQAFFDDFVETFLSFSGEAIAQRYASPYMAMRDDGTSSLYSSNEETARYFQRILDEYRRRGARRCSYKDLDVLVLGRSHLLATVTWELLDQTGNAVSSWRESYALAQRDGQYKITASIDHQPQ
jgi:hypothetical protein